MCPGQDKVLNRMAKAGFTEMMMVVLRPGRTESGPCTPVGKNTLDGRNSRYQYPEAVQPTESSPLWLKQDEEGKE